MDVEFVIYEMGSVIFLQIYILKNQGNKKPGKTDI
jgi:hypothetical protein